MRLKVLIDKLIHCKARIAKTEYTNDDIGNYWLDKSLKVEIKDVEGRPRQIKDIKIKHPGYFSGGTVVQIVLSSKYDNI